MRVLHVISTPRGHSSNTARISNVFLEALFEKDENLTVQTMDLFSVDLPAVAGSNIESKYKLMTGQALDDSHQSSWKQIEKTIENFLAADVYLLTVPMWNFGIPYALKYYIDAIVQPGYLFRYNEQGYPEGLVKGKKMVCISSRGGDYSSGPMQAFDYVEPYLRSIFGFVGITDMHFINVQPMDISPDARKAAIKKAIHEVKELVEAVNWNLNMTPPIEGLKPQPLGQ